ncbi:caspase domain-containing protein [Flammula alnicola]|nr:caspase domain-containing protein [Flammula alnicola]
MDVSDYPLPIFSTVPGRLITTRLFALMIAINTYKSKDIRPLRGAVPDAQAVAAYLENRLSVPQDHVKILKDEFATREAILGGLGSLANDPRIQRGDPIVIFYAGHGSEAAAPPGWEAGGRNANIQVTMPYDVYCHSGGKMVDPIPDRTLGALIEAISQKKGNNIIVIMDSCYSASGTRSFSDSPNVVRSVRPPSNFKLQESLDQEIRSLFPNNGGLQSHILLSACGSSGQAWESNGRGVFTVALLDLLTNSHIDKLRYCDIVMRMKIHSDQSPHCEGLNLQRCIFTTTSPSTEYFVPAYTRTRNNGPFAVILNGGAAHGLSVGDEFAVYPDMDCQRPSGTLIIEEVGSFYSIMRPAHTGFPMGNSAVATRVKEERQQPLRIYSRPGDKVFEFLSPLRDSAQGFSGFVIVLTPEESNIDISLQDDQAIVRLRNMGNTQGLRIEPTASELARILKASWQFFSELDRTEDFPDITQCVQVHIYELKMSPIRFPGAPTAELQASEAVPYASDSFTLRQGSYYGLKLTNNSRYNLYPTVQYFDPSNEFKFGTLVLNLKRRT